MRLTYFSALLAVFVAAGLAGAQDKKPATIKVLLPDQNFKEPVVMFEGVVTKATGSERTFTTPALDTSKEFTYKIEALIEPNNYTKITRVRNVVFKGGESVTVDLRVKDPKIPDAIKVRWVPTPDDIVDKMAEMAKITKDDIVFDPGCGDAVMLIRPVKKLGAKKGYGIDIDPKMVKTALENAAKEGIANKIVITEGDVTSEKDMAPLKEATVVLVYMGDDLGARMSPLMQKMLKPGSRVVSHRFNLGDWKPDKTEVVKGMDGDEYTLHLWIVKERKEEKKEEK